MSSKNERPSMGRNKAAEDFIGAAPNQEGKSKGKAPPEDTHRINANVPKELYTELKLQAVREDRTMTDIITDAVRRYLDE